MQSQLANQRSRVSIPIVVKQNFRLPGVDTLREHHQHKCRRVHQHLSLAKNGFDDAIATPNYTAPPEFHFIYLDWYETDLIYPYHEYRLSRNEKENDLFIHRWRSSNEFNDIVVSSLVWNESWTYWDCFRKQIVSEVFQNLTVLLDLCLSFVLNTWLSNVSLWKNDFEISREAIL